MKKLFSLFAMTALISTPAFAAKNCEELKAEIAAKIDAKGVKNYSIEIIPTQDVKDQKVIGWCEAGAKKLIYIKQ